MKDRHQEQGAPGRLVLPSLVVSSFATIPASMLVVLLLIEIAQSFGSSVGATGQIQTVSSIIAIISALLMGALSVRFQHKTLLMIGLGFLALSALGCFIAPNFIAMFTAYALSGLGTAMTFPMTNALVGEHLPLHKRSRAIGMITAGMGLAGVVSPPLISYIANLSEWRYAFLIYILPIPVVGLLLAAWGLPTGPPSSDSESAGRLAKGFRAVLANRSALACAAGAILAIAAWQGLVFYGISFFRQRFLVASAGSSAILSSLALTYTLGALWSGQLVDRFGRKPFTVFSVLAFSICLFLARNLPNMWLSLGIEYLGAFSGGLMATASSSLALEQVPGFRGTMMSISMAASGLGAALGSAIGGMVLQWFGWRVLGIALGLMGLMAAVIYILLAVDPTKT
jgi:DHA1 family purine base/nucleoside efflux pump-like MFS transporter